MNYFKNTNNEVYAYELDGSQDHLIEGKIAITQAEVDTINAQKKAEIESTNEYKVAQAKAYLASTDYKVLPDYDGDTTGMSEARAEARVLIRTLGA